MVASRQVTTSAGNKRTGGFLRARQGKAAEALLHHWDSRERRAKGRHTENGWNFVFVVMG